MFIQQHQNDMVGPKISMQVLKQNYTQPNLKSIKITVITY